MNEIVNVSDTALMVAACRAMETGRVDGLVHDPFAALLAGERGMEIARALPMLPMMCFGIGIRSKFLDELVMQTLEVASIGTVLSLGAGLDTRPWRLDIPEHIRWVEVDLPAILQYKSKMMADFTPKCRVDQVVVDLNESGAREALFDDVGDSPALMITEGLLMYLPGATVEAIAVESARGSGIRQWLMDLQTPAFSRIMRTDVFESVESVRAPDSLDGTQIFNRCVRVGWHSVQCRSYVTDVYPSAPERVRELAALRDSGRQGASAAPPQVLPLDDITGIHRFQFQGYLEP